MTVDFAARKWSSGFERIASFPSANHARQRISTPVRFCWRKVSRAPYAGRMSWVRAGILLGSVLLAHGAPRDKIKMDPAGGNANEIAMAREALRQATAALGE